jgi:DNA-binding response OmpR family regulator
LLAEAGIMKKLRVVVADEEPLSRNLLKSSLSYWGCDVVTVHSADEAYTALQAGNVDVCILNWEISGLNALEMCQWIRKADLKLETHIIVLTEKNSAENIRAAYLAGANDYLTKPLRVEDMRNRISTIANKVSQLNSLHWALGRLDPLECYRMDLASHAKAHNRI